MRSLYALANHVSSLSAQAVKTTAHTLFSPVLALGEGETTGIPTKFLVSNPSLLTSSRSYPHPGSATAMNDGKCPLGFKIDDIGVVNHLGSNWVYNFNRIDSHDHLGLNPNCINDDTKNCAYAKLDKSLYGVASYKDAICTKKNDQYVGRSGPYKVTTRSKSFIHVPSIAGETK